MKVGVQWVKGNLKLFRYVDLNITYLEGYYFLLRKACCSFLVHTCMIYQVMKLLT